MTQRHFIVGATGYTGREVVRLLAEQGHETIAHIRPDSPHLERWRDTFSEWGAVTDTTPWTQDSMTARLTEIHPTHLFSLLGTTQKRTKAETQSGYETTGYEAVDYGLTMMALNAVSSLTPAPRFIYLSSIGVNGPTRNAYLTARWKVEEALKASAVPYTIARPSFITGPNRDEFRLLERATAKASDTLLGGLAALGLSRIRDQWGSMTNTQLAGALIASANDPKTKQQVVTSRDLVGQLARTT